MITINLNDLVFFAHHGVHEEERILGNNFIVNVVVTFEPDGKISSLDQSLNYVAVYETIKQRMAIATPLLETLAQEMVEAVYALDDRIRAISVCVEKKAPPIAKMQGSVSVTCYKEF